MSHINYQVYGVAVRRTEGTPSFQKMVGHNQTGETRIFFTPEEAQDYADQLNREKGEPDQALFRVYSLLVCVEKEIDRDEIRDDSGGWQS
jgi:hypothetical protein